MERQACGATRRNQNGFSDTCTNAVNCDEKFTRYNAVFHDFHFHKLGTDERFLLSRGNDISSDNTS
jgi:hypothetical protein